LVEPGALRGIHVGDRRPDHRGDGRLCHCDLFGWEEPPIRRDVAHVRGRRKLYGNTGNTDAHPDLRKPRNENELL
jgi:hypothetical protein